MKDSEERLENYLLMRELLRLEKRISAASPGTTTDQFDVQRGNLDKLQISAQNQLLNAHLVFLQEIEEETQGLKHKGEDGFSLSGRSSHYRGQPPACTIKRIQIGAFIKVRLRYSWIYKWHDWVYNRESWRKGRQSVCTPITYISNKGGGLVVI